MTNLWTQIVEYLNGSCETLHHALDTFDATTLEDDEKFLNYLDSEIFNCSCCGWWCEVSDINEQDSEFVCNDCFCEED